MGKLGRLGLEPAQRYERERPGELVHVDVKKLGRIQAAPGIASRGLRQHYNPAAGPGGTRADGRLGVRPHRVDDATRLAYAEVLADEKGTTAVGFLRRARRVLRRPRHHSRARAHRQRLRLPLRQSTRSPAARWASATYAPGPTGPRPTAKPNASSAPCSPAGPTAPSTATAPNAPPPCPAGSTTTITDDPTAASATSPRPAASATGRNNLLGSYMTGQRRGILCPASQRGSELIPTGSLDRKADDRGVVVEVVAAGSEHGAVNLAHRVGGRARI